jgi:hypothetical protein
MGVFVYVKILCKTQNFFITVDFWSSFDLQVQLRRPFPTCPFKITFYSEITCNFFSCSTCHCLICIVVSLMGVFTASLNGSYTLFCLLSLYLHLYLHSYLSYVISRVDFDNNCEFTSG